MFSLDTRAVGLFRIALGVVLLTDQVLRLAHWEAFHGPDSILANDPQHHWEGAWVWSVYWVTEHRAWPYVLEIVRAGAAGVPAIRRR